MAQLAARQYGVLEAVCLRQTTPTSNLMNYIVYVISNPDGEFYKGVTSDLEKRLYYHNNGLSSWTRGKGPWELVHKEIFESKLEALRREKYLKSGKGRGFLKSIINGV